MDRVIITNPFAGLIHMQVCAAADATDAEILRVCNRENPSGTTNGWASVIRHGDNAPVTCADDPNRLHIFVAC